MHAPDGVTHRYERFRRAHAKVNGAKGSLRCACCREARLPTIQNYVYCGRRACLLRRRFGSPVCSPTFSRRFGDPLARFGAHLTPCLEARPSRRFQTAYGCSAAQFPADLRNALFEDRALPLVAAKGRLQ